MSLTDTQCRTTPSKIKSYKFSDSEGLYLEIYPSGSKFWRIKYRGHNKEKRLSLGEYPGTTLSEIALSLIHKEILCK